MKKESKAGRRKKESFEDALRRLEEIVQRMEGGDLSLEESLALFEEGVRLTRVCSERLEEAEKRIAILTRDEKGEVKAEVVDPGRFEQEIRDGQGEGEVG